MSATSASPHPHPHPHRPQGPQAALPGPVIRRGEVLVYRVFDVAEEIDLAAVERVVSEDAGKVRMVLDSAARGARAARAPRPEKPGERSAGAPGQALIMRNPPLRLSMGEAELLVAGELRKVDAHATLWDYGAVSIQVRCALRPGTPWTELLDLAEKLGSEPAEMMQRENSVDSFARRKSKELTAMLRATLKSPAERELFEDYVIYFLEEIEGVRTGMELAGGADLSALILGEKREKLSAKSRAGILEHAFQYAESDLAVIDWNSAILYEPSGQHEVADILEFAVTHLLELRYYDDLLDRRLAELYEQIGSPALPFWRKQPDYRKLSADANRAFIEFSEFVERVDNSLKVVGDFYLAVIFRAAVRRFRIPDWQGSVIRKMNLLARVSEILQSQANVQRGHTLEIIVILLIAFEIVSTMMKLF